MSTPEHPLLLSVAEALADGLPVDWEGLRERDPSLSRELVDLLCVEEMARAFRSLRDGGA